MEYDRSNLQKLYARLTIEDEEEGGIIVGEEETKETSIWRPKGRKGSVGYWRLQNTLVYKQVKGVEDPHLVNLNEVDIWMQVHDIPKGFILENILKSVAAYIGKYMKSDPINFDGSWKSFVWIRVTLEITKSLLRRMKIRRKGGNWTWLNFKYEKLGTFYFVCGILGHNETECNVVYANPDKVVKRAYGVWLRAPNRNVKNNVGARWLHNKEGGSSWSENNGGVKKQMAGEGELEAARFTEIKRVLRESGGGSCCSDHAA
ncbi:hypothetical protein AgCh_008178 [Apium graveolens]